jgi:hypothetical protein
MGSGFYVASLTITTAELERARLRSEQIDSELASEAAFLARKRQSEVTLLLLGGRISGR